MATARTDKQIRAINAKFIKSQFLTAFRQNGHRDLADKISHCGDVIENRPYLAYHKCRSVYCVKCHKEAVAKQTKAVRSLFDRYPTEADQRQNLFHLTIKFDAFRLFTKKGAILVPNPPQETCFPTEYAMTALEDARYQFKHKLRHQFPAIGYAGAFEWEVYSDETLDWRSDDKEFMKELLGNDELRDPRLSESQAHMVLFHAHIVVDLNGVPEMDFRKWMRDEFPKRTGLPEKHTVHLTRLYQEPSIDESIQVLARYPMKTYLHYKRPKFENPYRRIDGKVLAELASFRSSLTWNQIKVFKKPTP